MYPENLEGTQVIVGSMNMGYISDRLMTDFQKSRFSKKPHFRKWMLVWFPLHLQSQGLGLKKHILLINSIVSLFQALSKEIIFKIDPTFCKFCWKNLSYRCCQWQFCWNKSRQYVWTFVSIFLIILGECWYKRACWIANYIFEFMSWYILDTNLSTVDVVQFLCNCVSVLFLTEWLWCGCWICWF